MLWRIIFLVQSLLCSVCFSCLDRHLLWARELFFYYFVENTFYAFDLVFFLLSSFQYILSVSLSLSCIYISIFAYICLCICTYAYICIYSTIRPVAWVTQNGTEREGRARVPSQPFPPQFTLCREEYPPTVKTKLLQINVKGLDCSGETPWAKQAKLESDLGKRTWTLLASSPGLKLQEHHCVAHPCLELLGALGHNLTPQSSFGMDAAWLCTVDVKEIQFSWRKVSSEGR